MIGRAVPPGSSATGLPVADTLFIRFIGDTVEWQRFDAAGRPVDGGRGDMSDCRGALHGRAGTQTGQGTDADADADAHTPAHTHESAGALDARVVAVVPGERVLLTRAMVPSRQHRQILQAVPYVIEENLADDVEDCFFAIGDRGPDGAVAVSVVERDLLESWIEAFSGLDVSPQFMQPEMDLVAGLAAGDDSDPLRAILDGDRIHLRWRDGAMTIPATDFALTVSMLGRTAEGRRVELVCPADGTVDMALQV